MPEFLFDKNVDQSLLKSGLTVPKDQQDKLLKSISSHLEKGEKENINILLMELAMTQFLQMLILLTPIEWFCKFVMVSRVQFAQN